MRSSIWNETNILKHLFHEAVVWLWILFRLSLAVKLVFIKFSLHSFYGTTQAWNIEFWKIKNKEFLRKQVRIFSIFPFLLNFYLQKVADLVYMIQPWLENRNIKVKNKVLLSNLAMTFHFFAFFRTSTSKTSLHNVNDTTQAWKPN